MVFMSLSSNQVISETEFSFSCFDIQGRAFVAHFQSQFSQFLNAQAQF